MEVAGIGAAGALSKVILKAIFFCLAFAEADEDSEVFREIVRLVKADIEYARRLSLGLQAEEGYQGPRLWLESTTRASIDAVNSFERSVLQKRPTETGDMEGGVAKEGKGKGSEKSEKSKKSKKSKMRARVKYLVLQYEKVHEEGMCLKVAHARLLTAIQFMQQLSLQANASVISTYPI